MHKHFMKLTFFLTILAGPVLHAAEHPSEYLINEYAKLMVHAAGKENPKGAITLIEKIPANTRGSVFDVTDYWGRTALHYAAEHGYEDLAKLLIEKGANVNAVDAKGDTPLHLAALRGKSDVAKLLLDHGADVTIKSKDGHTALSLAERTHRKSNIADQIRAKMAS